LITALELAGGSDCGPSDLAQQRPDIAIARHGIAALAFAGDSSLPGQTPAHLHSRPAVPKAAISTPISTTNWAAARRSIPGRVINSCNTASWGWSASNK
jgi:hypothetical protein